MCHKTNFLFLFFMNSISTMYTAKINVIDADVDVGTGCMQFCSVVHIQ